MGRKKKIPLITTPRSVESKQRGVMLTDSTWDRLLKSVPQEGASSTLELAFNILHGVWYGNADATVEHNGDPLHHAASILESVAWLSGRDIDELSVRIIALRDLMLIIRDQRLEIERNQRNIHVK